MEFGRNKLLTIAIPTWNRAEKLSCALDRLLPQIEENNEYIEFIISDNASTDNTADVVATFSNKYPHINFVFNQQSENTGFYGNFQKCISLGTGKYFWLLSDDDYVMPNVITEIVNSLKNNEVGAMFLESWTNNIENIEPLSTRFVDQKAFFNDRPFRHSLISAVIYRHNVFGDDEIFEQLKGNALIGYAVFLKAIHSYKHFGVIAGNSLVTRNDEEIRFNALRIFTVDLREILVLLKKTKYSDSIINMITNSFIESNIMVAYKKYKFFNVYNEIQFKTFSYFDFYYKYKNFWIYIAPLMLCPRPMFQLQKRLRNIHN